SWARKPSLCAPMPKPGQRPCPSLGPAAASGRAHDMPRTNVVGTTAPSGSGAQRCAQAGEREHRTDSTTRPATATATGATAHKAKHYCRNPRCRSRLPEPVENEHHAFCTSGCHASFYRSRCLICEERMRRKDERQRCKSGHRLCQSEYRKFPRAYDFPREMGGSTGFVRQPPAKAHSTGLKSDVRGDRPTSHCLCVWWWGGDSDRDHSLYDRDGLTIARVVLEGDGRYHLRKPIATPTQAWAQLGAAKRGAESLALRASPLAAVGPKLAARTKRDNETPHPMGPPLNRPPLTGDATSSDWRSTGNGADVPDIPGFLRR